MYLEFSILHYFSANLSKEVSDEDGNVERHPEAHEDYVGNAQNILCYGSKSGRLKEIRRWLLMLPIIYQLTACFPRT